MKVLVHLLHDSWANSYAIIGSRACKPLTFPLVRRHMLVRTYFHNEIMKVNDANRHRITVFVVNNHIQPTSSLSCGNIDGNSSNSTYTKKMGLLVHQTDSLQKLCPYVDIFHSAASWLRINKKKLSLITFVTSLLTYFFIQISLNSAIDESGQVTSQFTQL